jgi:hypothetical protein
MNVRCLVFALLPVITCVGATLAQPLRMIGDSARDLRQTIQARQMLAADPELAAFNVGVLVHNRVATLCGPVPSAEVSFRAELCLKTMVELVEVRNELFVSEILEPVRKPLKIDLPPQRLPELLPPQLPMAPKPSFHTQGVLTRQDVMSGKKAAILPSMQMKAKAEAKIQQPGEDDLAKAVRALLQSNNAFRQVRFTIEGRRVFLKADDDTDALHDAARAVSQLPNVDGVILQDKMNR